MSQFDDLGLHDHILQALREASLDTPTPIQARSIPLALQGHDVLGLAQTGTGKTLAFSLPLIHELDQTQGDEIGLILAPTRELVGQIVDNLRPFAKSMRQRVIKIVGGQSINKQIAALSRGGDIIVATPGRLIDLMDRKAIDLGRTRFLVLDEADQMLDMGFIHALRKIAPHLGTPRQTMMFSATMPKQLEELSRAYLSNPQRVQVAPPGKTADKIDQSFEFMDKAAKPARLRELLSAHDGDMILVFARTKYGAEKMKRQLVREGVKADSVHGNKSQNQRDRAIRDFSQGDVTVLIATDVAARGIDIPGVALVINFDLPNVPEIYVHRIGRTARAGREGRAIGFCSPDERPLLRDIEKLIGRSFGAGGKPARSTKGARKKPSGGKVASDAKAPTQKRRPRGPRKPRGEAQA